MCDWQKIDIVFPENIPRRVRRCWTTDYRKTKERFQESRVCARHVQIRWVPTKKWNMKSFSYSPIQLTSHPIDLGFHVFKTICENKENETNDVTGGNSSLSASIFTSKFSVIFTSIFATKSPCVFTWILPSIFACLSTLILPSIFVSTSQLRRP